MFCAENYQHLPTTVSCLLPQKDGSMLTANCYNADIVPMCTDNGDVKLPYGSGPYIGMGLLVSVRGCSLASRSHSGRPNCTRRVGLLAFTRECCLHMSDKLESSSLLLSIRNHSLLTGILVYQNSIKVRLGLHAACRCFSPSSFLSCLAVPSCATLPWCWR